MQPEVLIIVAIVVGVIILATVFGSAVEQPKNRPPMGRDNRPKAPAGRRQVSDLDRFLEEARRRREAREAGGAPAAQAAPPPAPRPAPPPPRQTVPRQAPPLAPARERPARKAPERALPAPRPRPSLVPVAAVVEPIPLLELVPEQPSKRRDLAQPQDAPQPRDAPQPKDAAQPTYAPQAPAQRPVAGQSSVGSEGDMSASLAQVVKMLATPRTAAAAAFVLGEIFSKPRALRGPHRFG